MSTNNTMAILIIASVIMLVGGLVVIPIIEEAQAVKGVSRNSRFRL